MRIYDYIKYFKVTEDIILPQPDRTDEKICKGSFGIIVNTIAPIVKIVPFHLVYGLPRGAIPMFKINVFHKHSDKIKYFTINDHEYSELAAYISDHVEPTR